MTKIIAVTGISGSGSKKFCDKYLAEPRFGEKKLFHTERMLKDHLQRALRRNVAQENLLNLHEDILMLAKYHLMDNLHKEVEGIYNKVDRIIIDTHALFFWDKVYRDGFDLALSKIPIDMFVTIIDKPSSIKDRQMQTIQGKMQSHNLENLLSWQQSEVRETDKMAQHLKKPHYIFSNKQNPESVESLFDNRLLIYASFPMTDADDETTKKINEFKYELRNLRKKLYGENELEIPLIDPAEIDIETGDGISDSEKEAIGQHTIYRDLKWDVGKATHTIAYYPNAETDLSAGVTHECIEAKQTGKHVYLITPRVKKSPFLEFSALEQFEDKERFLQFFTEKIVEDLKTYKRK